MIAPVSSERWHEAQAAEITVATYDRANSHAAYRKIFSYFGIDTNQHGKVIVEVGCGPYPAVLYCVNVKAVVFEPLWTKPAYCEKDIEWKQMAFEDSGNLSADETWLFNVLQHVRDPELVIAKAKQVANTVRFFEPVDYPTCIYHPHTFTEDDFKRWFGESVRRYTDRLPGFFDADCCYGTWRNVA